VAIPKLHRLTVVRISETFQISPHFETSRKVHRKSGNELKNPHPTLLMSRSLAAVEVLETELLD
jgi:hypothetical protein